MKKFFKILLWSILGVIVLFGALLAGFLYKVNNGFPVSYETEKPVIQFPANQDAILVFSKTTGFRHAESIETSATYFDQIAKNNNYFIYSTEEGGVFNLEQLKQFKAVIFNNSTGRVLNDEQQKALEEYVEQGGKLIGIHGAGDGSHHWDWYQKNLLGTTFSHHPLNPQFQKATVYLESKTDSSITKDLAKSWSNTDEWYVFFTQPANKQVLYYINGDKIIPNGNVLWMTDNNFGMGAYHPVAWCAKVGKGRTFYTSMGHSKEVWKNPNFVNLIEQMIKINGRLGQIGYNEFRHL